MHRCGGGGMSRSALGPAAIRGIGGGRDARLGAPAMCALGNEVTVTEVEARPGTEPAGPRPFITGRCKASDAPSCWLPTGTSARPGPPARRTRSTSARSRLRQTKFGYILPVALVPAALSLDWFVYPSLFKAIFRSRCWRNLVLTPCWVLPFTRYARRLLWFLGNAWLWSPMVAIAWMIYASEGAAVAVLRGAEPGDAGVVPADNIPRPVGGRVLRDGDRLLRDRVRGARRFPPASSLYKSTFSNGSLLFNNWYFLVATGVRVRGVGVLRVEAAVRGLPPAPRARRQQRRLTLRRQVAGNRSAARAEREDERAGQAVGGLLHEVNNPLNFTFMALQIAEQEAEENAELRRHSRTSSRGWSGSRRSSPTCGRSPIRRSASSTETFEPSEAP